MAFSSGSSDGTRADINVTPLVDVCLVLLIIFMVVTPMLQSGVDVKLPPGAQTAAQKEGAEEDLVISIKADGTTFLGQSWIADADLKRYLEAEYAKNPGRNVMLKADSRIQYKKVREVMKAANEAKFSQVAILTEQAQGGS